MKWKTALLRLLWRWGMWRPYEGVPRAIWEGSSRRLLDTCCSLVDVTSPADARAGKRILRIEAPTPIRAAEIAGGVVLETNLRGISVDPWPGERFGVWCAVCQYAELPKPRPPTSGEFEALKKAFPRKRKAAAARQDSTL